jgi:hypothetical protein
MLYWVFIANQGVQYVTKALLDACTEGSICKQIAEVLT